MKRILIFKSLFISLLISSASQAGIIHANNPVDLPYSAEKVGLAFEGIGVGASPQQQAINKYFSDFCASLERDVEDITTNKAVNVACNTHLEEARRGYFQNSRQVLKAYNDLLGQAGLLGNPRLSRSNEEMDTIISDIRERIITHETQQVRELCQTFPKDSQYQQDCSKIIARIEEGTIRSSTTSSEANRLLQMAKSDGTVKLNERSSFTIIPQAVVENCKSKGHDFSECQTFTSFGVRQAYENSMDRGTCMAANGMCDNKPATINFNSSCFGSGDCIDHIFGGKLGMNLSLGAPLQLETFQLDQAKTNELTAIQTEDLTLNLGTLAQDQIQAINDLPAPGAGVPQPEAAPPVQPEPETVRELSEIQTIVDEIKNRCYHIIEDTDRCHQRLMKDSLNGSEIELFQTAQTSPPVPAPTPKPVVATEEVERAPAAETTAQTSIKIPSREEQLEQACKSAISRGISNSFFGLDYKSQKECLEEVSNDQKAFLDLKKQLNHAFVYEHYKAEIEKASNECQSKHRFDATEKRECLRKSQAYLDRAQALKESLIHFEVWDIEASKIDDHYERLAKAYAEKECRYVGRDDQKQLCIDKQKREFLRKNRDEIQSKYVAIQIPVNVNKLVKENCGEKPFLFTAEYETCVSELVAKNTREQEAIAQAAIESEKERARQEELAQRAIASQQEREKLIEQCQSDIQKEITEFLSSADGKKVLAMQFELTSLKLALRVEDNKNWQVNNLDNYIRSRQREILSKDREKVLEGVKQLYQRHQKPADLELLMNRFSKADYGLKQRLDNHEVSAFILAETLVDKNSEFSELDSAVAFMAGKINGEFQQGTVKYNRMNLSSLVFRQIGQLKDMDVPSRDSIEENSKNLTLQLNAELANLSNRIKHQFPSCFQEDNFINGCKWNEVSLNQNLIQAIEGLSHGIKGDSNLTDQYSSSVSRSISQNFKSYYGN